MLLEVDFLFLSNIIIKNPNKKGIPEIQVYLLNQSAPSSI